MLLIFKIYMSFLDQVNYENRGLHSSIFVNLFAGGEKAPNFYLICKAHRTFEQIDFEKIT